MNCECPKCKKRTLDWSIIEKKWVCQSIFCNYKGESAMGNKAWENRLGAVEKMISEYSKTIIYLENTVRLLKKVIRKLLIKFAHNHDDAIHRDFFILLLGKLNEEAGEE